MKIVVVGGGSWGTAFAQLLRHRGHDVTLACRDAEQARAIAETGRNPRYLPQVDLHGVAATTVERRADRGRRAGRGRACPSAAFAAVVERAAGRRRRCSP